MRVSVATPGREVISSGSITLGSTQPSVLFFIEDLQLNFRFEPGAGEPTAVAEQPDPKTVNFTLKSFDNPLGTTYELPNILTVEGRPLSLVVFIHANNGVPITRVMSYTLTAPEKLH